MSLTFSQRQRLDNMDWSNTKGLSVVNKKKQIDQKFDLFTEEGFYWLLNGVTSEGNKTFKEDLKEAKAYAFLRLENPALINLQLKKDIEKFCLQLRSLIQRLPENSTTTQILQNVVMIEQNCNNLFNQHSNPEPSATSQLVSTAITNGYNVIKELQHAQVKPTFIDQVWAMIAVLIPYLAVRPVEIPIEPITEKSEESTVVLSVVPTMSINDPINKPTAPLPMSFQNNLNKAIENYPPLRLVAAPG